MSSTSDEHKAHESPNWQIAGTEALLHIIGSIDPKLADPQNLNTFAAALVVLSESITRFQERERRNEAYRSSSPLRQQDEAKDGNAAEVERLLLSINPYATQKQIDHAKSALCQGLGL